MSASYNNLKKIQHSNTASLGNSYTFDKKNSLDSITKENNFINPNHTKRQNFVDSTRLSNKYMLNDKNAQSDAKIPKISNIRDNSENRQIRENRENSSSLNNRYTNRSRLMNSSKTERKSYTNTVKQETGKDLGSNGPGIRQQRSSCQQQKISSPIICHPQKEHKENKSYGSGAVTDRISGRKSSRPKTETPVITNTRNPADFENQFYKQISSKLAFTKDPICPKFEETKTVIKDFGRICAFGVNTHRGVVRNYNEDRVSILLNAQQRFKKITENGHKNCCLFGIFDGHGGNQCCNYLKEYLFSWILSDENFTTNTQKSISESFQNLDLEFLEKAYKQSPIDTSGSTALVMLILDDFLYFLNTGDSRAILSRNGGRGVIQCTRDHKPSRDTECARIIKNQGLIYRVANVRGKHDPQMITAKSFMELEK